MKKILIILLLHPFLSFSQKQVQQEIELKGSHEVSLNFKWPDLVSIKYHDKNVVRIEGTVSINYGKYDDAFSVSFKQEGDVLRITGEVQGIDTMEQVTVIREKDGSQQVYDNSNGNIRISNGSDDIISTGVIMDIYLTIFLPYDIPTVVEAKFGMIEVLEVRGPLTLNSKFGGVDITIDEEDKMVLKAATSFGDIFTNLTANFRGNGELNKVGGWHRISTSFSGGGKLVQAESKFGNIYLRKR